MAAATDKPAIEPLDVANYATWRPKMKFLLITKGLWMAIEGESPDPVTDLKALATIGLWVKDHHLAMLDRCSTAREAWLELESTYQAKTNARKLALRKELAQLKQGATEPVAKYVARAKDIQAQLSAAGHDVPDQELAWTVMAGLHNTYETVCTVLETTEAELTLDKVLPHLVQVEQRHDRPVRLEETALMAAPSGGPSGRPFTPKTNQIEDRACYYCGKKGHLKRDCRKKKSDEARRRGGLGVGGRGGGGHQQHFGAIALTAALEAPSGGHLQPSAPLRFVLDTGASRHITRDGSALMNARAPRGRPTITFGNGGTAEAVLTGEVELSTPRGTFVLHDVLYVPEATENLISVRAATKRGLAFTFHADRCEITMNGAALAVAPCTGDTIYYLHGHPITADAPQALAALHKLESPELWHRRYAHLGYENLARLQTKGMVNGITTTAAEFKAAAAGGSPCEPCALGKGKRAPFQAATGATTAALELLHTDLCGPLPVPSLGGSSYFCTVLDDYSKLAVVTPLASKADTPSTIKRVITLLETRSGVRARRLRCDNGTEYINRDLKSWCEDKGIQLETTVRYTPEQNGAAERLNRTLLEKVRPMLADAALPKVL